MMNKVKSLLHDKVGQIIKAVFINETLNYSYMIEWEDGGISWTNANNFTYIKDTVNA